MALVCDFTGELLTRPFQFPMTMAGHGSGQARLSAIMGELAAWVAIGNDGSRPGPRSRISSWVRSTGPFPA